MLSNSFTLVHNHFWINITFLIIEAVNDQVMHESAIQHTVEVHASPATSFIASDAASRIIELLQMQKDLPLARTSFIFFQPCVKLKNSS
jgi:hypothetical protein